MGTIFLHEIAGTAILLLLGVGVVANVVLTKTKGNGGGWLLISFGWGLGVFAGVYVAAATGAHLNPAVTVGLLVSGAEEYAPGIAVTLGTTLAYFAAQLIGAFLGAALAWLAYRDHYQAETDQGAILGTFATGPEIRNPLWNMVTEVIATFVLVFVILLFGSTPSGLGPLAVALLVVAIGASLGGPTGYAINPARDLGPRLFHAVAPIRHKGGSDWGYAWVPIVPTVWLLACTLSAGWIKIFDSNPGVGFLAQANKYRAAINAGELIAPSKDFGGMHQIMFNNYVNAGLTALFMFVVLAVLFYSVGAIRKARANPARSDRETAYVALTEEQQKVWL